MRYKYFARSSLYTHCLVNIIRVGNMKRHACDEVSQKNVHLIDFSTLSILKDTVA